MEFSKYWVERVNAVVTTLRKKILSLNILSPSKYDVKRLSYHTSYIDDILCKILWQSK